jgi:hypothetical protein
VYHSMKSVPQNAQSSETQSPGRLTKAPSPAGPSNACAADSATYSKKNKANTIRPTIAATRTHGRTKLLIAPTAHSFTVPRRAANTTIPIVNLILKRLPPFTEEHDRWTCTGGAGGCLLIGQSRNKISLVEEVRSMLPVLHNSSSAKNEEKRPQHRDNTSVQQRHEDDGTGS